MIVVYTTWESKRRVKDIVKEEVQQLVVEQYYDGGPESKDGEEEWGLILSTWRFVKGGMVQGMSRQEQRRQGGMHGSCFEG